MRLIAAALIGLSVAGVRATDAAESNMAKDIARCAQVGGDLDRLTCYDDVAKGAGLTGPQSEPVDATDTGRWEIKKDRNPIDDSERVLVTLESDTKAGILPAPVTFIARCQSSETEAYVVWNRIPWRR